MSSRSMCRRWKIAVCAKEVPANKRAVLHPHWDVVPCISLEEVKNLAQTGALDAVALPFDAMDENARFMFIKLTQVQKDQRPILVSYATFNPDWIENLVFGIGANIHLRGSLDLDQVFGALDEHIQHNRAATA